MTSVRCHGARNHVDDAIPFHGGVTAIVIHASRDDNMTDPGGQRGSHDYLRRDYEVSAFWNQTARPYLETCCTWFSTILSKTLWKRTPLIR
jgi:hypothetical protein